MYERPACSIKGLVCSLVSSIFGSRGSKGRTRARPGSWALQWTGCCCSHCLDFMQQFKSCGGCYRGSCAHTSACPVGEVSHPLRLQALEHCPAEYLQKLAHSDLQLLDPQTVIDQVQKVAELQLVWRMWRCADKSAPNGV